ncbi:uncharacterized protein LOC141612856 [Silene latifolia]|uniref:uncharacterized protein LOC141612856 n=1 Tax=Silene latifolia TaxID=37657 RepID=UPI003D783CDD
MAYPGTYNILLEARGQKLILTLWEKLADQMASSTTEFDKYEHRPIVIIRYAKIKTFQDSNVSNSLCSKILLLDAEIHEVRNFIKRKIEVGLKSSSSSSTIFTSYCESVANELLDLPTRRTIDEIREIQEEGFFVTLATITAIDTEFMWYIESCKKCKSTLELDDKEKWYKVRVKVADHTGNATFILFYTQATDLIKQSAKQLRDNQLKQEDPNAHPSELDVLLNRKFIFKVKVDEKYNFNNGWKSYGVNKLSQDKDLILKYLETCTTSQKDCLEVDSREESVVQNTKGKESIQSIVEDESVTSSMTITPTKRSLDAYEFEDDAQLSTTKKHAPDQAEFISKST